MEETQKILETLNNLPDALRDKLDTLVRENWDELVAALFELARGVYYEKTKTTANGGQIIRIYREKPDKEVAQYLLNQVVGKPAQKLDITSDGKEVGVVLLPAREFLPHVRNETA